MNVEPDIAQNLVSENPVRELVERAEANGIELWVETGVVRFRYQRELVAEELLAHLRECKLEVQKFLELREPPQPTDPAVPSFYPTPVSNKVPSFRLATWNGIKQGLIGVDSANGGHTLRLRGTIDVAAMKAAIEQLVSRHDALGASSCEVDGEPWLSFETSNPPQLELHDLAGGVEKDWQPRVVNLVSEHFWRPFDLNGGRLFRALLVKVDADTCVLSLVIHHLISDSISIAIILAEVVELYEAIVKGRAARLSGNVLQYRDYLVCLDAWLRSPAGNSHLDYWKSRLLHARPVLPAFAYPGAAVGTREPVTISSELRQDLNELAARIGTTVFVIVAAAHRVVLARMMNSGDVTIGFVTNGRELPALHRVVGYFADRVYLRAQIDFGQSLNEVIENEHAAMISNSKYQFVRSDIVHAALAREGSPIVAPILNFFPPSSVTTLGSSRGLPFVATRFAVAPAPTRSGPTPGMCYWMALVDSPQGMTGHIRYHGAPIDGLLSSFQRTLEFMAAAPATKVSEI